MPQTMTIEQIRNAYPNEWVLVGNAVMDEYELNVLSGVPLYHSKDKKEVCYIGRDKTAGFTSITITFTGEQKVRRKMTGIFNRITP